MALQDINLVPDIELTGKSPGAKRSQAIMFVSFGTLMIFLVVLVGLFLLFTFSNNTLRSIRNAKKPIESEIALFAKKEFLQVSLASKTDALQNIMNAEPPFRQIVDRLVELEPSDLTYTEITITPPNKILLAGRATSFATLDRFLGDITAKEFGRKTFSNIVLQSLSRSSKGEYEFSLLLTYTGK